ncbi:MAG: hypothetical protein RLZZ628_1312 [Bacteroidota bacterium]|jgi:hypothetical protein
MDKSKKKTEIQCFFLRKLKIWRILRSFKLKFDFLPVDKIDLC